MNKKILVPLGQLDRSEEMIPYIEKVARPDMNVIFLVRYPVDGIRSQKEEYGMRAPLKAKELVNHYSWEGNLQNAQKHMTTACEALRARGIEASVDVYAGSLKKAVRSHMLHCRALQSRTFKSFKWFKTFKSIPDIFNGLNAWNVWNDWHPRNDVVSPR